MDNQSTVEWKSRVEHSRRVLYTEARDAEAKILYFVNTRTRARSTNMTHQPRRCLVRGSLSQDIPYHTLPPLTNDTHQTSMNSSTVRAPDNPLLGARVSSIVSACSPRRRSSRTDYLVYEFRASWGRERGQSSCGGRPCRRGCEPRRRGWRGRHMARPRSRGLRCVDCKCLRGTGMTPQRVYHSTDLALICIRRCRKSLAALSSSLLRKAKIASVRPRILSPYHIQQRLTPQLYTVLHKGANFALPDLPNDIERHLTGISHLLLQNEIPWAGTLAYLEYAHARGIVTTFNPSPMPSDTELRAFPWTTLSWLLVSEGEAESLLRAIGGNREAHKVEVQYPVNWPDDKTVKLAFSTLNNLRHGERLASTSVVCTLGAAGVLASICGLKEILYLPAAALEGNVRDTTGAGDCLTGYFVAGLMELRSEQLSVDEAVGLLRLSVQVCTPLPPSKTVFTQPF